MIVREGERLQLQGAVTIATVSALLAQARTLLARFSDKVWFLSSGPVLSV